MWCAMVCVVRWIAGTITVRKVCCNLCCNLYRKLRKWVDRCDTVGRDFDCNVGCGNGRNTRRNSGRNAWRNIFAIVRDNAPVNRRDHRRTRRITPAIATAMVRREKSRGLGVGMGLVRLRHYDAQLGKVTLFAPSSQKFLVRLDNEMLTDAHGVTSM